MMVSQFQFLLAARNVNDWFEILIFVLIFGGSFIGTITKKLIAYFSPEVKDNKPSQAPLPKPAMRPPEPTAPVARPMTAPRPSQRAERLPPIRPQGESLTPLRPVAGYPKSTTPARPVPRTANQPVPIPIPKPRPTSQVPATKARSRRQLEKKSSATTSSSRKASAAPPQKKATSQHEHGLLVDLHEKDENVIEDVAMTEKKLSPRERLLGSRASLRDAMILSEVLAPPLAMRDSSNESG